MVQDLFKVDPDNIENNDIKVYTDANGDLIQEHQQTGAQWKFDSTANRWVPVQGIDLQGAAIVDDGTTVYDGSTDQVGDGTTDADHNSLSADDVVTDSETVREVPYNFASQLLLQGSYNGFWRELNFEDPTTDWTATNSTISQVTSDVFRGSSAIKMTGSASNSTKAIDFNLSSPADFSGLTPSLAVRLAAPASSESTIRIQLFDTSNNYLTYNAKVHPSDKGGVNEWIRVEPAPNLKSGSPDLTAIEQIRISQSIADDTEVYFDDLRFVPTYDKGQVILFFDDAVESHYTKAYDTLEKYGLVGACAIRTDIVGQSGKLSKSQMQEMENSGWDMCNHTNDGDGLAGKSESAQRERIKGGREWLQDNGFRKAADILVYPRNQYDQTTLDLTGEYCSLAFTGDGPNPENSCSPYYTTFPHGIRRGPGDFNNANVALSDAKTAIDRAVEYNQIAVFSMHTIDGTPGIDQTDLDSLCAYIDGKGDDIQVTTPSNWRDNLAVQ